MKIVAKPAVERERRSQGQLVNNSDLSRRSLQPLPRQRSNAELAATVGPAFLSGRASTAPSSPVVDDFMLPTLPLATATAEVPPVCSSNFQPR